jgi:cell division protein FtsX
VKKFRNLWYTGLAIIGIPTVIILFASFLVLVKNIKTQTIQMEENKEQVQDTVYIEKKERVIVKDTVYIRVPNPKPQTTQVKDTL